MAVTDLRQRLNLTNIKHAYIMRSLNYLTHLYVVVFDTRYHERRIPKTTIKRLDSVRLFYNIKITGEHDTDDMPDKIKFTPPLDLDLFNGQLTNRSVFLLYDIAGKYYQDRELYEFVKTQRHETMRKLS